MGALGGGEGERLSSRQEPVARMANRSVHLEAPDESFLPAVRSSLLLDDSSSTPLDSFKRSLILVHPAFIDRVVR